MCQRANYRQILEAPDYHFNALAKPMQSFQMKLRG
jgi:hypothetical protein